MPGQQRHLGGAVFGIADHLSPWAAPRAINVFLVARDLRLAAIGRELAIIVDSSLSG
jgi:hypothetical protein